MDLRRTVVALAAGTAAFLLVAVAVTAALEPRIEFSVFLGLPAGFIAGVLVAAVDAVLLGDPDAVRYGAGVSIGAAGVTVLVVAVAGTVLRSPLSTTLYTAVLAAAAVGIVAYLLVTRTRLTGPDPNNQD